MSPRVTPLWIAVAAIAFLAGCGPQAPQVESVRPVKLEQVRIGGASASVFAGEVRPRHETDLSFRIPGKLIAREVDIGARVGKGQVLARLDPADVGLQAEAAKALVAATETEYKFAQSEYERYQNLHREKFISASALDAKRNTLDANRAKFEQAKANLAVSRNQLSYAVLVAPEAGVVTAVAAEPGQVVTAGQMVARVAREGEREVSISVPENRLREIKSAQQLVVSLWADPERLRPARVREISPAVDPATRTFNVRVTILDADPSLSLGMTATVGLVGSSTEGVTLIPLTALYQNGGAPAVWRYDAATHKVSLSPVKVGQYREDGIVVTSGVAPGDWIVAAGVHRLRPGQIVRPYDAGPVAPALAGK